MIPAVAYCRVSSKGQESGDGLIRQTTAISLYAQSAGYEVLDWYEDVITGTSDLEDRPGLAACLERVENNGVKTVIVESADRLARDAMVFELSIREFKRYGATVLTASGVNLTEGGDDNPTAALIRGILALISEFDKRVIVLKLRAARNRKKQREGRCEGVRPYGSLPGESELLEHILTASAGRFTAEEIAVDMNTRKMPTRSGRPWRASTIRKIIARNRSKA